MRWGAAITPHCAKESGAGSMPAVASQTAQSAAMVCSSLWRITAGENASGGIGAGDLRHWTSCSGQARTAPQLRISASIDWRRINVADGATFTRYPYLRLTLASELLVAA